MKKKKKTQNYNGTYALDLLFGSKAGEYCLAFHNNFT